MKEVIIKLCSLLLALFLLLIMLAITEPIFENLPGKKYFFAGAASLLAVFVVIILKPIMERGQK